ncbi:hypothetical protein BDV23DRAFT_167857, partial [Aspergillus alliaceus]
MKFFDAPAPNPMAVRLFVLERGGLSFNVETIDIMSLQNRRLIYRAINPRGEVPALQLDNGTILTEITAIYEYFDEIAVGGTSLFGTTPEQRAETRMWLRRMDLYGLMKMMTMQVCDWMLLPGRENFLAYWKRLEERDASQKALQGFPARVAV